MPYYLNKTLAGIISANTLGDAYSINLKYSRAFNNNKNYKVAYNIYYGVNPADTTFPANVFDQNPNFVVIDGNVSVDLYDFEPGVYHFGVRALEYDPTIVDPSLLQIPNSQSNFDSNVRSYPVSLLSANISETDTVIPLIDNSEFPNSGLVRIGAELIRYLSKDTSNNLITTLANRGFHATRITEHQVDGYDGYYYRDPNASFWLGVEERNTKIFAVTSHWDKVTGEAFTFADGYRQRVTDLLTSDLSGSDALNETLPSYDYTGYHSTDPTLLLNGECVGSYLGGERYCADGYSGVGRMERGFSLQESSNQRQEMLLSVTGEPVCLLRKRRTGIYCECYHVTRERADERCPKCLGSGFVFGWSQYYFAKRSDGRILVRFSPANEDVKSVDAGMESELNTECWTLTYPTIKDRDIIVRFDQDDNEEFRYEVMYVNRNRTINRLEGAQKFSVQRVRKTDPIYQIPVFRNTSSFPSLIETTEVAVTGIPLHSHEIKISEKITSIFDVNQITSVSQGHSHVIRNGVMVSHELNHVHDFYIPL